MHIKYNPITKVILYPIIAMGEWLGLHYPKLYMEIRYLARFGRPINLKNPRNLNEKILWYYFNTDTTSWTELSDKLKVRQYVREKGCGEMLKKVYAEWREVGDVDFKSLPNSFVLKCNNGSGTVEIVKDKSLLDEETVLKKMRQWMEKTDYGYEYHYRKIKNRLFAEEYLPIGDTSSSIVDYKFWCFNGKPYYVWVCSERRGTVTDTMIYDMNWTACPQYVKQTSSYRLASIMEKPQCFDDMASIAKVLSHGFPVVRVDLFESNGRPYFGEMTFTSVGGMNNMYSEDFLNMTGDLIPVSAKYNGYER